MPCSIGERTILHTGCSFYPRLIPAIVHLSDNKLFVHLRVPTMFVYRLLFACSFSSWLRWTSSWKIPGVTSALYTTQFSRGGSLNREVANVASAIYVQLVMSPIIRWRWICVEWQLHLYFCSVLIFSCMFCKVNFLYRVFAAMGLLSAVFIRLVCGLCIVIIPGSYSIRNGGTLATVGLCMSFSFRVYL